MRAPTARASAAADAAIAAAVSVLQLANCVASVPLVSSHYPGERLPAVPAPLSVALAVLGGACLVSRRRAPLVVLVVATTCGALDLGLGYPPGRPLAVAIALLTVAETSSTVVTAIAGTVSLVALSGAVVLALGWMGEDLDDQLLDNLLLLLLACLLGWGIQLGRARTSALREQADRLSREHAVARERALRQEQSRIAREMHDVVAHHVSVITAQAAGARRVFDRSPELAREALAAIEATGREAMTEMRRALGLLRPSDAAGLDPPPTLDRLPALIAGVEQAGLPVRLSVTGGARPLPPAMELNAVRIVQEALTNVMKHAGASRAAVDLHTDADALTIRIRDDGHGYATPAEPPGPGRGLIGMRERAALHGGTLLLGTAPEGGLEVQVRLPLEHAAERGPAPRPAVPTDRVAAP
ncbi:MAG: sensor histidine kinase [Amnibacterium sp.]